jgi:hypothetical protein
MLVAYHPTYMKVQVKNRENNQDTVFHNVKKASQGSVRNQENDLVTIEKYDGSIDEIENGYIECAEDVGKSVYSVNTPTLRTRSNVDRISVIPNGIEITYNKEEDVIEKLWSDDNKNNMIKRVLGK